MAGDTCQSSTDNAIVRFIRPVHSTLGAPSIFPLEELVLALLQTLENLTSRETEELASWPRSEYIFRTSSVDRASITLARVHTLNVCSRFNDRLIRY